MITPPIPADEAQRLQALRDLLLLDTPPEERFDRLVQFAADEFEVPIAVVSLVDDERQWFKAKVGLDVCGTGRDVSFCGHAVVREEVMVVEDARLDPRFADNPLVTSAPFIRFYAGAPLQLPSGQRVGTLCLIDTQPRCFDHLDQTILSSLRRLVVEELIRREEAPSC